MHAANTVRWFMHGTQHYPDTFHESMQLALVREGVSTQEFFRFCEEHRI